MYTNLTGRYPRKKKVTPESNQVAKESAPQLPEQPQGHSQYAASNRPAVAEDAIHKTVFLGESSPLTCVVDEGRRSPDKGSASKIQKGRLRYSISDLRGPAEMGDDQRRNFLQDRLTRESALVFPSSAVCDVLLQAYFEWFHPCFPIVDRPQVHRDYRENQISPLLLQAMLFLGVSLCSDVALSTTGYSNRYQAKGLFYQRAKEIYNVGWETDPVIKLQSLFLMSFWRGGPNEECDVRFWLGVATGLAQKKGMHVMYAVFRSTVRSYQWKQKKLTSQVEIAIFRCP